MLSSTHWPYGVVLRSPGAPWEAVDELLERLVGDGLAIRAGAIVRLSDRGRLLADAVGAEMMEAFTPAPSLV